MNVAVQVRVDPTENENQFCVLKTELGGFCKENNLKTTNQNKYANNLKEINQIEKNLDLN